MRDIVTPRMRDVERHAAKTLGWATLFCFAVMAVGQWIFIGYLAAYYIDPALRGGLGAWAGNGLATGYVEGDFLGNGAVAAHIFLAAFILLAGHAQLAPQIRRRWPRAHRWTGRFYVMAAVTSSLAGLYMTWARGNPPAGPVEHIGTSIGAGLILFFAWRAWGAARHRRLMTHRRWALRLFMVVGGVWFIRVGYGLWFILHDGAAGPIKAFSVFISYAQYMIPLAVLELYFQAQSQGGAGMRYIMAALLLAVSLLAGIGVYAAAEIMWLPRINGGPL